jgi:AcrR family transcriptional regulator
MVPLGKRKLNGSVNIMTPPVAEAAQAGQAGEAGLAPVVDSVAEPALDTAKRRQIVEGARAVFLEKGFEGASMNDIARAAGVSKGTLYVYFTDKERLFAEIVDQERNAHMLAIFDFDHDDADIEAVLTRVGVDLATFLSQRRIVSAMRAVMGIAARMPEMGRHFYERGPAFSRRKLSAYLDARVAAGQLTIDDTTLAAGQFLELCHSPLVKPLFFEVGDPPSPERIRVVVASAVRMFVAAYRREQGT